MDIWHLKIKRIPNESEWAMSLKRNVTAAGGRDAAFMDIPIIISKLKWA
jgi:hypothetical protein